MKVCAQSGVQTYDSFVAVNGCKASIHLVDLYITSCRPSVTGKKTCADPEGHPWENTIPIGFHRN